MTKDINKDEIENLKKQNKEFGIQIKKLEGENKVLADKIDKSNELLRKDMKEHNSLLRKDLNKLLDGTEENPGILREIRELKERFPKLEKD